MHDKAKLAKILELAEKASKGPWGVKTNRHPETTGESWGWIEGPYENWCWSNKRPRSHADASYIVAACNHAPEIARQLLKAMDENEQLREKYEQPNLKCGKGHVNNLPLALWDCPMCTEELRKELAEKDKQVERLERVAEAAKELVYDAQLIERSIAGRDSYHLYAEDIDVLKQALAALEAGVE